MTTPPPIRDAATVMLMRDTAAGIEVLMLRRSLDSDFVGGAYVFPGGAVDPADREDDLSHIMSGRTDAQASRLLALGTGGLAYWAAAVRECFEEAGLLLAYERSGSMLSLADEEVARRFDSHRRDLNSGKARLRDICLAESLTLALDRIHYVSHWVTPVGPPRRYDTRFFVAVAPPEQVPLEDQRETIASLWIRPADAIESHRVGKLHMILPTIRNLEAIGRFDCTADLIEAAATMKTVPTIRPRLIRDGEQTRIVLPGDPLYDEVGDDGPPEDLDRYPPEEPGTA